MGFRFSVLDGRRSRPPPPLGRQRRSWTSGPSAPELGRFDTRPTCAKRVPSRHGTDRIPGSLATPHSRPEGRAWARHAFRAGADPSHRSSLRRPVVAPHDSSSIRDSMPGAAARRPWFAPAGVAPAAHRCPWSSSAGSRRSSSTGTARRSPDRRADASDASAAMVEGARAAGSISSSSAAPTSATSTAQLQRAAGRPGRLHLCLNRGSEVFAVGRGRSAPGPRGATARGRGRAPSRRSGADRRRDCARAGFRAEIVAQRLNRRKIDLIPEPDWVGPAEGAHRASCWRRSKQRLRRAGIAALAEVVEIATAAAQRRRAPGPEGDERREARGDRADRQVRLGALGRSTSSARAGSAPASSSSPATSSGRSAASRAATR